MMRLGIMMLIMLLTCIPGWAAGPKAGVGALLGAGTGALIGSTIGDGSGQVAAVVIGTLAGALVGQNIGSQLDGADQRSMQANAQQVLEYSRTDQAGDWVNPDTGHAGKLTPLRTYRTSNGQYCREYQQVVTIAGDAQRAYGTACRQPDGSWLTVNPNQALEHAPAPQVVMEARSAEAYAYSYRLPYYSPYRFYRSFGYPYGYGHYGYGHRGYGHRDYRHRGYGHNDRGPHYRSGGHGSSDRSHRGGHGGERGHRRRH